jgi:DNA polymerase-3 subunit alpha
MNVVAPEPVHEDDFVLVFDTETTGLFPRNANPQEYALYDGARMVEIAWEKYTVDGRFHSRESYIVTPNGFTIPDFAANIHGITTDMAHALGHQMTYVWSRLMIALERVVTLVAHNISFDNGIILSEMHRYAASSSAEDDTAEAIRELIRKWTSIPQQCTMLMGASKMHTGRWMKLAALYVLCFGKEPDLVLHRAAADTAICREIYFHLTKL